MANQDIFGQLGLDMDPDAIIKARTQEAQDKFDKTMQAQAANLKPADRGVFTAAAAFGRALGKKPVGQLTDQEKQKLAIIDMSNIKMKELQKTPEWEALSPRDKALKSQETIGRAAMEVGDIQTGSRILLDTATKRQSFALSDKELEKIGANIDDTKASTEQKKVNTDVLTFNLDQAKIGETGTFSVPDEGSGKFNFGEQPEIVTGKVGPDGVLRASNGREYDKFLSNKDFDMFADNLSVDAKDRATSGTSATTKFLTNFSASERKGARMAAEDIGIQTEIIRSVGQVIKDAGGLKEAEAVVGTAGGMVKAVDSMWRTLRGSVKNLDLMINTGGVLQDNGKYAGGENKRFDPKDYIPDEDIPSEFAGNAEQAAKYRSAIMQAVYIDARLAEPGARQLSDADIKNAMDRLGVRTNSPASIMQTLMQNMERRQQGVRRKIEMVGEIGEAHGLKPEHARELVFGKNAGQHIQDSTDALSEIRGGIKGLQDDAAAAAANTPAVNAEPVDFGDGFTLTPAS